AAVGLDRDAGKELWKSLAAKEPGYSAPALIEAGGKKQVVIWHAQSINGLNPQTGEKYWSVPLEPQFGMSIMTPRQAGDYLFAGGIGNAARLPKLPKGKPAAEKDCTGEQHIRVYT